MHMWSLSDLARPRSWKPSRRTVRSDVDFVITFEELQAMFDAKKIDLCKYEAAILPSTMRLEPDVDMRWQAVWQKRSKNVLTNIIRMYKYNIEHAEGLAECKKTLTLAKAGKMNGCLIEGMGCPGGCVAGAGTNIPVAKAQKKI